MRLHTIEIVVDSMSFKKNYGSTVGFQNYCHLARNLPLRRNNYKKKSIEKIIYHKHTYKQTVKT